jgi:hypothetical protein
MKMLQIILNQQMVKKSNSIWKLIPFVTEKIIRLKCPSPYVGQDQIGANKFIINKVKVLNHRWIIADLVMWRKGECWGAVLMSAWWGQTITLKQRPSV